MTSINQYLEQFPWLYNLVHIIAFFLIAWVAALVLKQVSRRVLKIRQNAPVQKTMRPERQKTLEGLIGNAMSLLAFGVASLASVGLFVGLDTLAWVVGLFSAAFGLGARPLISDYLAGISFIFEDTFAVGEKVELPAIATVEGIIESINLRTTTIRASSGELYVIPNGEIRTVRNFSRGKFSLANVIVKINAGDLARTLPLLEDLGREAVILLPNLLEPWRIISESGVIGQHTELTLVAKARFGKASEMRPRLLALIHERLVEIGVEPG